MKRFEERKTDLINATNRLKEALEKEADDITIDGVLHRYEFTFELAWKTLKDYLEYLGISSNTGSPREVLKESYAHNLIENGEVKKQEAGVHDIDSLYEFLGKWFLILMCSKNN